MNFVPKFEDIGFAFISGFMTTIWVLLVAEM